MTKRLMEEEKNQLVVDMIRKYMEKEYLHDFKSYVSNQQIPRMSNVDEWMYLARKELSQEEFARFYSRVHPLEPDLIVDDVREKEELKKKVVDMATRIYTRQATLFDVLDEVTPSLFTFMTMLKECAFKYKILSKTVYCSNWEWIDLRKSYVKPLELSISYLHLQSEEVEKIHQFIRGYGLPINNITFKDAYECCKERGIININKR